MYDKIKSRQELVDAAKKIEPPEKRIEFIMGYFKDNLKYNYMELLIDVSMIPNFSLESGSAKPGSFLDRIGQLCQKHNGNYDAFMAELRELSKQELKTYIQDDGEIDRNARKFIDLFEERLGMKDATTKKVPRPGDLISVMSMKGEAFPPIIDENGILKEGVCRDFSEYLLGVMKESGIENVYTIENHSGNGTPHEWMLAKIGNKYLTMDMNGVTSIRDQKTGLSQEDMAANWMGMDLAEMFRLCPNKVITHIAGKKLKNPITAQNYTPEMLAEQCEMGHELDDSESQKESTRTSSKEDKEGKRVPLGKIAARGLKGDNDIGITAEEIKEADKQMARENEQYKVNDI